jgi:hypothetical protein
MIVLSLIAVMVMVAAGMLRQNVSLVMNIFLLGPQPALMAGYTIRKPGDVRGSVVTMPQNVVLVMIVSMALVSLLIALLLMILFHFVRNGGEDTLIVTWTLDVVKTENVMTILTHMTSVKSSWERNTHVIGPLANAVTRNNPNLTILISIVRR